MLSSDHIFMPLYSILGISIRTLRNKLKAYSDEGLSIPTTEELEDATT